MNKEILKNFLKSELNIENNDDIVAKFSQYEKLLLEWNEKFNLTAITKEDEILEKHFIDSIYPMKFLNFDNISLADIGSGAGFPGIPLAICNPFLNVTLIESNTKKCNFLNEVINQLSLQNVKIVNLRAEEVKTRETYDFVTARAVISLNILLELTMPLLKIKGHLLSYKLFDVENEISSSKNAMKLLDCHIIDIKKYELPLTNAKRSFVIVEKIKQTKNKYPRQYCKISSKPL